MGKAHENYKPTDYEEMLIAAKWIGIEDVDTEYQEYLRGDSDPMIYTHWLGLRQEWNELDAEYQEKVQPFYQNFSPEYGNVMPYDLQQVESRLMRRMGYIETALGY